MNANTLPPAESATLVGHSGRPLGTAAQDAPPCTPFPFSLCFPRSPTIAHKCLREPTLEHRLARGGRSLVLHTGAGGLGTGTRARLSGYNLDPQLPVSERVEAAVAIVYYIMFII